MYEEIVSDIRKCLDSLCGECKYKNFMQNGNFVPCMNKLLSEAADAIEELSKQREYWELEASAQETDINYLIDENRWISVYDWCERIPLPESPKEET